MEEDPAARDASCGPWSFRILGWTSIRPEEGREHASRTIVVASSSVDAKRYVKNLNEKTREGLDAVFIRKAKHWVKQDEGKMDLRDDQWRKRCIRPPLASQNWCKTEKWENVFWARNVSCCKALHVSSTAKERVKIVPIPAWKASEFVICFGANGQYAKSTVGFS